MIVDRLLPRSRPRPGFALAAAFGIAGPDAARAADPDPDKSGYSFLHPTPTALLRELSADRPDKTESAFTVDAGHVQLEMDIANLTLDRPLPDSPDVRVLVTEIGAANLKLGLWNDLDLQLVLPTWHHEEYRDPALDRTERVRGFTDLVPRVKWNLWGNDGGRTALALLPFVKVPTATGGVGNGAWEGGLKVPLAVAAGPWDLSLMTEVDILRDGDDRGHHPEFVNSISLGREVANGLSLAVEFFAGVSTESGQDWVGTVDTWLTYQVSPNLRFDAGVYIGVTRAADDWHPFVGLTWRH